MVHSDPKLTPTDFDWLRRLLGAADADRNPSPVPAGIASKLRAFGFVAPGGLAITDRGRGAVLEQDMRDAEDR